MGEMLICISDAEIIEKLTYIADTKHSWPPSVGKTAKGNCLS